MKVVLKEIDTLKKSILDKDKLLENKDTYLNNITDELEKTKNKIRD